MVVTTRSKMSQTATQTDTTTEDTSQDTQHVEVVDQSAPAERNQVVEQPTLAEENTVTGVEQVRPNQVTMTCTIEELVRATTGLQQQSPPSKSKLKPPAHNMETDMQQYLQLFATVAKHNNWNNTEAGVQLRCYLSGSAQRLSYLHPDYDFNQLEEVLLERFALSAVDARYRIRRLARSKNTTPEELADEIHKLVRTGHGHRLTTNQLEEEELEVFLDALDWPDLAMHITTAGVTNLHAAIKMARSYQGFRDRRNANRSLPQLRELDGQPVESVDMMSEIRESLRQIATQSTTQTENQKIECYICKGRHYASGCPDRPARVAKKERSTQNQEN